MKCLTLHQPYATLLGLSVKRIETRSWSTRYRGPLAIHAGKRKPLTWWQRTYMTDAFEAKDGAPWHTSLEAFCHVGTTKDGTHTFADWKGPLGAVVATCTLVDVVPIVHDRSMCESPCVRIRPESEGGPYLRRASYDYGFTTPNFHDVTRQFPYGTFEVGRYAWLLDNIVALDEPIPAKGKQGLWTWER